MILALDFETTSADPETCDVIEVGAVLYDEVAQRPIAMMNELVSGHEVPPEITKITHITQKDVNNHGYLLEQVRIQLLNLCLDADFLVAHNANAFDRIIFNRVMTPREECPYAWIDTITDVPYPDSITIRKLPYLAAEHGFCNPFSHRAVFDCLTMLKIMSQYDFSEIVEMSQLPLCTLIAQVSYDDRELAKARGYRWEPLKRLWMKQMKIGIDKEINEAGFGVKILEEIGHSSPELG